MEKESSLQNVVLNKNRMDNVQKHNNSINIPSLQTSGSDKYVFIYNLMNTIKHCIL
jgi:hypothetical protein